jgi:hypothetical protein
MKYVLIVSLVLLGFNCVMSKDGDSKKESVGTVIGNYKVYSNSCGHMHASGGTSVFYLSNFSYRN